MKQKVFSVFLILTVNVIMVFLIGKIGFGFQEDSILLLDEGWEITLNDEPLSETVIHEINEKVILGDTFILKKTLPTDTIPAATLRIYSVHATFSVFLDDEPIYTYGDGFIENYGFIPQGYTLIPLPPGYESRELTITYTAAEDNAFSGFKIPVVGTLDGIIRYWLNETALIMFAGVYLLIFGFVTSVIAVFTIVFYKQKSKALAGGLLSMNIGVFALAYSNSLFVITCNLLITSLLEYISQISLLITVFALAKTLPVQKRTHTFFNFCFLAGLVSFFCALILQFKNDVSLPMYLIYYQRAAGAVTFILCIILAVILIRMLIGQIENRKIINETDISKSADLLLYLSLFTIVFFLLLELLLYQLMKYLWGNESSYSNIMFVIGIYGFSVLIFLSYLFYDIASIQERNQSERLEKMAYTDVLTGLYNKAFFDNALKKLTDAGTPFSVLMMDVNNLKMINDTLGHDQGDALLKAFADILSRRFRKTDILCRIGGDEFLVVMANGSAEMCQSRISELMDHLKEVNAEKIYPFTISVAVGYAISSELGREKVKDVITLADKRMYEIKRVTHSESTY